MSRAAAPDGTARPKKLAASQATRTMGKTLAEMVFAEAGEASRPSDSRAAERRRHRPFLSRSVSGMVEKTTPKSRPTAFG